MKTYDIIIIGAGISGLSLAHYCAGSGMDVLVLEKKDEAGGCLDTRRFDGGFWLELGAHTCYNTYGNFLDVLEDCGMKDRVLKRANVGFRIYAGGKVRSIFSGLHWAELLTSAPRMLTLKKSGMSVKSYYSAIAGGRNYEEVLGPAFNAVISQKADTFPADLLFKKRPGRRDVARKFTLEGGLRAAVDRIAGEPGIELLTGKEVKGMEFDGAFRVFAGDGTGYESRFLVLATPVNAASVLLQEAFPGISARLSGIRVNRVESMGVVLRREAVSLRPLAGFIPYEDIFHSVVTRDAVPDDLYRGFAFHFQEGIDYKTKLRRITEVLGIKEGGIEHIVTGENHVPALSEGHVRLLNDMDGLIRNKPLLITGNYFGGLAVEDCVSRSLAEFRRLGEM